MWFTIGFIIVFILGYLITVYIENKQTDRGER